jgi:hypothetical protein
MPHPVAHAAEPRPEISVPNSTSRDFRVRIPTADGNATEVRFQDTGKEVRVSVRTPDAGLAEELRGGLDNLQQQLAGNSVHAEMWRPHATAAASQDDSFQDPSDSRGSGSNGHGDPQGRREDSQDDRPRWLQEMEAAMDGAQT